MDKLVTFALQQRILMVLFLVVMLVAGTIAFIKLNIEAYPDPVPPMVEIVTQSTGQSAEEIEQYIGPFPLKFNWPEFRTSKPSGPYPCSDCQISSCNSATILPMLKPSNG